MHWQVQQGDVRERLAELPAQSVQCCVTSPPYWGLRDYGHVGQIGLEATPAAYVGNLVEVFAAVRRVLKDDGTVWLNLGDSYQNAKGQAGGVDPKQSARRHGLRPMDVERHDGIKPKDLVGIPWRVAFALQADGWYLRSDIIWSKPNPMPESVTDRPTKAHEYIFLLSKSARYYYDAAAIREPYSEKTLKEAEGGYTGTARKDYRAAGAQDPSETKRRIVETLRRKRGAMASIQTGDGANKRSVWHVATRAYPDAHFATYPEDLILPCILAGSKRNDTVLDPFNGSGTTGAVAVRHQRNYIGIELNPEYVTLARTRIGAVAPLFAQELTA